jgi:hypothetical protein
MKARKLLKIVKDVREIAKSDDPGRAAGRAVRAAVTIAHPVAGAVGGKLIEEGTKKLVDKGIEIAKDPEVQRKARAAGDAAGRTARDAGETAGRVARKLGAAGARKLGEFRGQIGGGN